MKSVLLGATFLAGASVFSAANAADVYARGGSVKDGPVDYRPAISWTGFYVGVNAGSTVDDTASLEFDDPEADFFFGGDVEVDNTWLAGAHVGYNWQTPGNIVLGVEGDISVPFDDEAADFLASIRGRLGYAFGNALLYGTGGVAFLGGEDDTVTGWVAGVGLEYKLRQNVSLGLEGLYYNFEEDFDGFLVPGIGDIGSGTIEEDFWTIRARLTYHFGGDRHDEPLK